MHPKYDVPKTYNVTLDKPLKKADFTQIKKGFLLEDGFVQVDHLIFRDKTCLKLELKIHIGRNRIVRRIFDFFNYEVKKLDRISYSFLNKDGLEIHDLEFDQVKNIPIDEINNFLVNFIINGDIDNSKINNLEKNSFTVVEDNSKFYFEFLFLCGVQNSRIFQLHG